MPYKVQFVGLVCFYRENGSRQALLPDGRDPALGLDRHFASILVDPASVQESTGWTSDSDTERGIYMLPKCSISIEGADTPGILDISEHDKVLPQLKAINHDFEIDPEGADIVARLSIRQGKLVARRVPMGKALMSELEVPHDGSITVTVRPSEGSPRTLRLAPGTEILLGNMAKDGVYGTSQPTDGHFRIYEKLGRRPPVPLPGPGIVQAAEESDSEHWLFRTAGPISLTVSCTNTGCC